MVPTGGLQGFNNIKDMAKHTTYLQMMKSQRCLPIIHHHCGSVRRSTVCMPRRPSRSIMAGSVRGGLQRSCTNRGPPESHQSKVVDDHAAHRTARPDARLHTLCIQTPHFPTRICEGFAKTSPAPCRNLPRNKRHHTKTRNQICTRQPQNLEPIQQRPHHTMR